MTMSVQFGALYHLKGSPFAIDAAWKVIQNKNSEARVPTEKIM